MIIRRVLSVSYVNTAGEEEGRLAGRGSANCLPSGLAGSANCGLHVLIQSDRSAPNSETVARRGTCIAGQIAKKTGVGRKKEHACTFKQENRLVFKVIVLAVTLLGGVGCIFFF